MNLSDLYKKYGAPIVAKAKNEAYALNQDRINAQQFLSNDVGLNRNVFSPDVTRNTFQQFPQQAQKSAPTRYIQNQIVAPITQGIAQAQVNREQGKSPITLNTVSPVIQGGFGATPAGLSFNVGLGLLTAVAKATRTRNAGHNFLNDVSQMTTTPTNFAEQGLNVKNPTAAFALNMAAANPVGTIGAVKELGNIKNAETVGQGLGSLAKAAGNFLGVRNPNAVKSDLYAGEKAAGGLAKEGTFSNLADQKPRFEINDSNASLIDSGVNKLKASGVGSTPPKLGELLSHDSLFKQYPELKNVQVKERTGTGGSFLENPYTGEKTITIGSYHSNDPQTLKSILIHEIQHAIQQKEGFAKGGNPDMFASYNELKISNTVTRNRLVDINEKLQQAQDLGYSDSSLIPGDGRTVGELKKYKIDYENKLSGISKQMNSYIDPSTSYKRLAGEVEARDAAARASLTPEQRLAQQPYTSQGILPKDQIVRYDNTSNAFDTAAPTVEQKVFAAGQNVVKTPFVATDQQALDAAQLSTMGNGKGVNALSDNLKAHFQGWANSTRPDTLAMESQKVKQTFAPLDKYATQIEGANTPVDQQLIRFQSNKPADQTEANLFGGLKDYFNQKYQQLTNSGVPVQYQENYLKQLWADTPKQLDEKVSKALSLRPGLTKEKVIANYQEGIAAGLTPKYTKLSDIAAAYEKEANRAIADTSFLKTGIQGGVFTPNYKPGFEALQHFPPAKVAYENGLGQSVEHTGQMYAPENYADLINNNMGQAKILNTWSKVGTELKNIVLSGGIPGTSYNFHGFTTIGRDVLSAGNPVKAIRNAVTDVAAMTYNPMNKAYIAQNIDRITELMHSGMTMSTEAPGFKEVAQQSGKLVAAGKTVLGAFENPLFQGFIPATKSRYAIEAMDNFMKAGLSQEEAASNAAHAANTIFGGNNLAELGKNKDYQNVLRSIFLAPDTYRSLGKTATGAVMSIVNPKNPDYWAYRSIVMNTAAAYTLMNLANKQQSGHYMYENAPGHTFEIQSGYDQDGNIRYVRPTGQALDFIKLPVDVLSSVKGGDLNQVARIVQNRLTPVLSQAVQLATNTNSQGQSITKAKDTPVQKLIKYAANTTNSFLPQGISSGIQYAAGEKNAEQAIASGLELPLRYGHSASSTQEQAIQDKMQQAGATGNEIGKALETYRNNQVGAKQQKTQAGYQTTGFVQSSDAPKNIFDTVSLYANALIKDPVNAVKGIVTDERLRKMNGDVAVFERKNGLSLTNRQPNTQVDHKVALALGGSNDASNLQAIPTVDNQKKALVDDYLLGLVKNKSISKSEAQKRDTNWQNELVNIPQTKIDAVEKKYGIPVAKAADTSAQSNATSQELGVTQLKNGKYMFIDSNGGVNQYSNANSANVAAAKDLVLSGAQKTVDVKGTTYYQKDDGTVGTYKLADIKQQVADQQLVNDLETYKRNNDYASWIKSTEQQYNNLQALIDNADPVLDQANVLKWQNTQKDIIANASKYQSYGGAFTKPKKPKLPKKATVKSVKSVKSGTANIVRSPKIVAPKVKSMKVKLAKVRIKVPKRA